MLNIYNLQLGAYFTNCYIIHEADSETCCVIDPGARADKVLALLQEKGLRLEAILLTHGHFDHVGAVQDLAQKTGCRVFLCEEDLTMPPNMTAGPLFYTDDYHEGDVLNLAGLQITVLHTPGHTPGSVCLVAEDAIFSGDTLFAASCGRTDLPGGDPAAIERSLRRLRDLAGDYRVFPGHSIPTVLSREREYNRYMK
ncbi:MAG: MBL fold metallo-hydrolase [Ruminococcaceae bacterium]|nr:MBL fold metallo-hydrolase [Oscillospiraceae bacterium]